MIDYNSKNYRNGMTIIWCSGLAALTLAHFLSPDSIDFFWTAIIFGISLIIIWRSYARELTDHHNTIERFSAYVENRYVEQKKLNETLHEQNTQLEKLMKKVKKL